ncbi:VWA domain-containing protein [Pacificoceanicola onchidii]|uniref:VWA domain-containing protein n=1 Tax=Pacificoceanicola onchidii TaxID=2562685 RepID=UPI0010A65DD0|nr:VWA domain-containing protein [Pacificoceanicola onchidii]
MKMVSDSLDRIANTVFCKPRSATGGWLGRFMADQSGSMSYFAVVGALVMMVFGGIGIDMIYAELKRNKVQNTLDRAVIAAANVTNEMDPSATVEQYFSAMGMSDALQSVDVMQDANNRQITAVGGVTMPSHLMGLIGVDTLQADGLATAVNGVGNVEISLVLDISNSMNITNSAGVSKVDQLKEAAKSFVDTLLPADNPDPLVSISIVPYSATVNLGDDLAGYFNIDAVHPFSNCVSFESSDYATTAVNTVDALNQIAHFDPYGGGPATNESWCPAGNNARIIPHSSDATLLKAEIDALVANGNTAIDLGVKWGASLLDPSARPIIDGMVSSGAMSAPTTPRPSTFEDTETMKFIVVMTDGQNTSQYDLKSDRKYGMSNAWVDDHGTVDVSDDRISIKMVDNPGDANDVYLWTHLISSDPNNAFRNQPYSWTQNDPDYDTSATIGWAAYLSAAMAEYADCDTTAGSCTLMDIMASRYQFAQGGGPRQMDNTELHARLKTSAIGNSYYWFAYSRGVISYSDYYDAYYAYEVTQNGSTADAYLSQVCGAAKDNGVVIYAIGVEAPAAGLAAMSDCATSPAHYYDVNGSELNETFSAIARTLQTLRLIQ